MKSMLLSSLLAGVVALVLLHIENFAFPGGESIRQPRPMTNHMGRYLRRLAVGLSTSVARVKLALVRAYSLAARWLTQLHDAAVHRMRESVQAYAMHRAWGHARAALRAADAGNYAVATRELFQSYRYARVVKSAGSHSTTDGAALGHALAHTALMVRRQLDEVDAMAYELVARPPECQRG